MLKCSDLELSFHNPFLSMIMKEGRTRLVAGTQVHCGKKDASSRQQAASCPTGSLGTLTWVAETWVLYKLIFCSPIFPAPLWNYSRSNLCHFQAKHRRARITFQVSFFLPQQPRKPSTPSSIATDDAASNHLGP